MAKLDWYIRANLKLRHLQLLVALDDFRSVGRVAAHLNVSQPAVSKTLAMLEEGLEVALFDRSTRGMEPTEQSGTRARSSTSSPACATTCATSAKAAYRASRSACCPRPRPC
jgi:hypothetical protein